MKNYSEYSLFDYLNDDDFVQWIKHKPDDLQQFWDEHLKTHPSKIEQFEQAKYVMHSLQFRDVGLSSLETKELLKRIEQTIQQKHLSIKPKVNIINRLWIPLSAAASIAVILIALFVWLNKPNEQIITTIFGETKHISLPDGSLVILNANSTLTYPTHWRNRQTREVELKGEAFFKVKKSERKDQKFVVNTEKAGIEVLGTQFNVNTRRNNFQIVLNSGEVSVYQNNMEEDERGRILLSPGEMLTFEEQQGVFLKQPVDTVLYTAWKDNKFILKQTPLNDIIRILEDNFNYTIIVRDSALLKKEFVGTFPKDDPDILFSTFSTSLGVEVNGNTIIFKNK